MEAPTLCVFQIYRPLKATGNSSVKTLLLLLYSDHIIAGLFWWGPGKEAALSFCFLHSSVSGTNCSSPMLKFPSFALRKTVSSSSSILSTMLQLKAMVSISHYTTSSWEDPMYTTPRMMAPEKTVPTYPLYLGC